MLGKIWKCKTTVDRYFEEFQAEESGILDWDVDKSIFHSAKDFGKGIWKRLD